MKEERNDKINRKKQDSYHNQSRDKLRVPKREPYKRERSRRIDPRNWVDDDEDY